MPTTTTKTLYYDGNITVSDLENTINGDEATYRARLKSLSRAQKPDGTKLNEAVYTVYPPPQPYSTRSLYLFDVTNFTPQQRIDLDTEQLQSARAAALSADASVYLNNNNAVVAAYRDTQ